MTATKERHIHQVSLLEQLRRRNGQERAGLKVDLEALDKGAPPESRIIGPAPGMGFHNVHPAVSQNCSDQSLLAVPQ